MKPTLPRFISALLVLFTLHTGDLKANPESNSGIVSFECADDFAYVLMPTPDDPCYPPGWQNCYNITQTTATWSWASCNGANSYSIQWCYPGGSWYDLGNVCYNTWVNVGNLQCCQAYQWRVRANCSSGYCSSWCSPYTFNTICNYCESPYGCYSSDVNDCSASLHWDDVSGAQSYQVQYRLPNGTWIYLPNSPCYNNWINVYNLQQCTNYEWRVRACCGYNTYSNWTYTNDFTTDCYNYCSPPEWQQCYNITDCSATWKWAACYGADYYMIQWCNPGGAWCDLPGGPFYGTWCNVNYLNPCTTYQWRVKSYCHYGGWSSWCYPYTFNTSCNLCPVPSGLLTKDIGDYKATLKWSSVYGASSYSVQLQDYSGNWYDVPGSPTTGVWITVNNLSPCKSYTWRVRANCDYSSHSNWSSPRQFSTTCGHSCHAPDWVYSAGITSGSATLRWSDVDGADYYVVEWRTAGGIWNELQGGPWTNEWAEIAGCQSNTTYEWHVKCHCYSGSFSDWSSTTSFTTLGQTCGMPFFRFTLPITDSTATFNWTEVTGALNYTVQIRPDSGLWQDVVGSPTTATSITATMLTPNKHYEWRMQVNCSNGAYSPWQSAIKFFTATSPGCNTPLSLYEDQLTLNAATLHWSNVPGAISYSVEIRVSPHGTWKPVTGSPVDTNFVVVDSLSPFTDYVWHVRANCAGGYHSFYSGTNQFTTTNLPPCNPPQGLVSSSLTDTTATFTWSPVSGANGYKVQTRFPNGTWIDLPGGGVVDTTVLARGFTPNTTYEWRVRTQCDSSHLSNWSTSRSFTTTGTQPGNNDCANAILLKVETSCVSTFASNVNATPSNPPPAGGCWVNGYKDVWFKFTMPDVVNPAVTIRTSAGSLGNAVMEVYSGSDCSILSLIACEDNNDNGNGSSMPVINLTGTPHATIWVRVWGFDGAAGTFTICVFNYISFNLAALPNTDDPAVGESLIELDQAVPVTIESETKPGIHVSPNPVSDVLNVEVIQTEKSRVMGLRMMDLSGKITFTQKFETTQEDYFYTDVDVSNLVPGIYLLLVQTTSGVMVEKVSVIR